MPAATRLRATQLALPCWSNTNVVFVPTLKLVQLAIPCGAVCCTVTIGCDALPDCTGVERPVQVTGFATPELASPLGASPFGTLTVDNVVDDDAPAAAVRAAA